MQPYNNNNNIILYSQSGIEHVHVQYKTYKEKKSKKYTNNWQFPVQIVQDMYHNSVKSPVWYVCSCNMTSAFQNYFVSMLFAIAIALSPPPPPPPNRSLSLFPRILQCTSNAHNWTAVALKYVCMLLEKYTIILCNWQFLKCPLSGHLHASSAVQLNVLLNDIFGSSTT